MNWKDITSRAAWTFIQASLGVIAASLATTQTLNVRVVVLVGVASVASLVKGVIVQGLAKK